MIPAHKQMESVKKYLLGTLRDDEAALIEEQSFVDPKAFEGIQLAEHVLIEDYLRGTLTTEERGAFETRYLSIPALRKKLEAGRREQLLPQGRPILRAAVVVSLAMVIVVGGGIYWQIRNAEPPGRIPDARPATVVLTLVPGVNKGAGESQQLVLPPPGTEVTIRAELPGQALSSNYAGQLFYLDQDTRREVWRGNTRSFAAQGGQQTTFAMDASTLQRGDYLLEVEAEGGTSQETYFFRVIKKEHQ